jgi:hypothetical protein
MIPNRALSEKIVPSRDAASVGPRTCVSSFLGRRDLGWHEEKRIVQRQQGRFFFPRDLPSHIVCIISLVALAVAIVALYVYLAGSWRWIYVASAVRRSCGRWRRRSPSRHFL